ncbi:MAG: peptidase inhibitor family I36 protein, partial [Propionibacteriaceae bacterium]|nr:peptidase inhibitor family I36 protein [Propionibacteriaceae bacterium]
TMAVTVVTAPTAAAAYPPQVVTCARQGALFCGYWDINFGGARLAPSVDARIYGVRYFHDLREYGWNDKMSSVYNNTYQPMTLYQDIYERGPSWTIYGTMWVADFTQTRVATQTVTWNDQASSIKVYNNVA